MSQNTNSVQLAFFENFLLSGTTAALAKTTAAPIERVKLLMQNQNELVRQKKLKCRFNGIADCALSTLKNEGLLSFWRGNMASVIRYFPQQALNFAFKDKIQRLFDVSKTAAHREKFVKNILSGGFAGSLSLCFVQSIDYTRTRLATDAGRQTRQFSGIVDVYRKTFAADGIAGLYRGFCISCSCIFVYRGLYFGLYDSLKPIVTRTNDAQTSRAATLFALGWIVTLVSGCVAYPIDSVKRRMMLTSISSAYGENLKYASSWHCFRSVVITEGWRALFNGVSVNIVRSLAGAAVLSGFDFVSDTYIRIRAGSMLS